MAVRDGSVWRRSCGWKGIFFPQLKSQPEDTDGDWHDSSCNYSTWSSYRPDWREGGQAACRPESKHWVPRHADSIISGRPLPAPVLLLHFWDSLPTANACWQSQLINQRGVSCSEGGSKGFCRDPLLAAVTGGGNSQATALKLEVIWQWLRRAGSRSEIQFALFFWTDSEASREQGKCDHKMVESLGKKKSWCVKHWQIEDEMMV